MIDAMGQAMLDAGKVMDVMLGIYGARFSNLHPTPEQYARATAEWAEACLRLDPEEIERGITAVRRHTPQYPPPPGEFVQLGQIPAAQRTDFGDEGHQKQIGYTTPGQAQHAASAAMGEQVHEALLRLFGARHTSVWANAAQWTQACHGLNEGEFRRGMKWLIEDPPKLTPIPLLFWRICKLPADQTIPDKWLPGDRSVVGDARKDYGRFTCKRMHEGLRS